MKKSGILLYVLLSVSLAGLIGCSSGQPDQNNSSESSALQDSTDRIAIIEDEGLSGTEAVRYDPDLDVYFISNFNGSAGDADANGFIARAQADGTVDSLRFMTGTENAPLHSPRGMYITGDTLYVADLNGVHGFNTQTGEQLLYTDFSSYEPGFLNDVAVAPDGTVYVTDTGQSRVYQMKGSEVTIALDSLNFPPNGITLDTKNNRFVIAPWNSGQSFGSFASGDTASAEAITVSSGGNFDGIEPYNDSFLVASQNDSSLYLIGGNGEGKQLIKTAPKPADIAFDSKRNRVAVPYIRLNRVDIWELKEER